MHSAVVRWAASCLLAFTLCSCGHASSQARLSRAMVGSGVALMVLGALAASGCEERSAEVEGCSGEPGDADPEVGLPVMAVGAGLIAGGLVAKPKDPGPQLGPVRPLAPSLRLAPVQPAWVP